MFRGRLIRNLAISKIESLLKLTHRKCGADTSAAAAADLECRTNRIDGYEVPFSPYSVGSCEPRNFVALDFW